MIRILYIIALATFLAPIYYWCVAYRSRKAARTPESVRIAPRTRTHDRRVAADAVEPGRETLLLRSWRGHESLWKVFWLYAAIPGAFVLVGSMAISPKDDAGSSVPAALFLVAAAAWLVWCIVSIWRCAFNVRHRHLGYAIRIAIVLFGITLVGTLVGAA